MSSKLVSIGESRGDHRGAIGDVLSEERIVPYGHGLSPMDIDRPLWTGEVLQGEKLAVLDADEAFARFVFARASLDLDEGRTQTWVLGGATFQTAVERGADGRFRLLVAGHEAPMPLPCVYAASVSDEFRWLTRGELPRWKRRALLEAGVVGIPDVQLAALPEDTLAATRAVYAGIELLVRVRVLGGELAGDPVPLSRPFLCRWVPASERAVRTGMEELERLGHIHRAGVHVKSGGRRPLRLWTVELVRIPQEDAE